MKALKPLILAFSLAAFAGAYAADDAKKATNDSKAKAPTSASSGASAGKKSFSELDKNNDGSLSQMEAAADADAKSGFAKLDRNSDKKLSRAEYEARQSAAAGATAGKKAEDKPAKSK